MSMSKRLDSWDAITRELDYGLKWIIIFFSTFWIPIFGLAILISSGAVSWDFFWIGPVTSIIWLIVWAIILFIGPKENRKKSEAALASHGKQFDK